MGTQVGFPIDTILTRREPQGDANDVLRIVGGGNQVVVTSNIEFGPAFEMSREQIVAAGYDYELPGNAVLSRPTINVDPGLSPEEVFARDQGVEYKPPAPVEFDEVPPGEKTIEQLRAEQELAQKNEVVTTVEATGPVKEEKPAFSEEEIAALARLAERKAAEEAAQAELEAEPTGEIEEQPPESEPQELTPEIEARTQATLEENEKKIESKPKRTSRAKKTAKK